MRFTRRFLAATMLLLSFQSVQAQEKSNIQTYTPSKLLQLGQWDIKLFNNFYSEDRAIFNGEEFDLSRRNFYTANTEVFYGVSSNARLNVGLVVNLKSSTVSSMSEEQGFFSPAQFRNEPGTARFGLGAIAPSVKFVPFRKISNFSIQSSFFIPIVDQETEDGVFLDKKSYVWETRFFYDRPFADGRFQLFTEIDAQLNLGEKEEGFANNSLGVPFSLIGSYFPTSWSTIYLLGQQYALIDLGNDFSQEFTQFGLGTKFQLNKVLQLELLYTRFVRGTDTGLGETVNLGLRAIF